MLSEEVVTRGSVRVETLTFQVGAHLSQLRRQTTTSKHFGAFWKNVGIDSVVLGDYAKRDEPYKFVMPRQVVPTMLMAKGDYRVLPYC